MPSTEYTETLLADWDFTQLPADLSAETGVPNQADAAYPLNFGAVKPSVLTDAEGTTYAAFTENTTDYLETPAPGGVEFFDLTRFDPGDTFAIVALLDLGDVSTIKSGGTGTVWGSPNDARGTLRIRNDGSGTFEAQLVTNAHDAGTTTVSDIATGTGHKVIVAVFFDGTETTVTAYTTFPRYGIGNANPNHLFKGTTTVADPNNSTTWTLTGCTFNEALHGLGAYRVQFFAETATQAVTQAVVDEAVRTVAASGWKGSASDKVVLWGAGDSQMGVLDIYSDRTPGWPQVVSDLWGERAVVNLNVSNGGARIDPNAAIGPYDETDGYAYAEEIHRVFDADVVSFSMISTNDIADLEGANAGVAPDADVIDLAGDLDTVIGAWKTGGPNAEAHFISSTVDMQGDAIDYGRGLMDDYVRNNLGNFDSALDRFSRDTYFGYEINRQAGDLYMVDGDGTHLDTAGNKYLGAWVLYPLITAKVFGTDARATAYEITEGTREVRITLPFACDKNSEPTATIRNPSDTAQTNGTATLEESGTVLVIPWTGDTPAADEVWTVELDITDRSITRTSDGIALASEFPTDVTVTGGGSSLPTTNLQIAASGAPGSGSFVVDFGTPVSSDDTTGLIALEEDGVAHGAPLSYPSSLSGVSTMTVTIGSGSVLDVGKCYTVTVDAAAAGVTRDSDGADVATESDLPVHLALDFRAMTPATGVSDADLGLDAFGAVIASNGNARWILQETSTGVVGFTNTLDGAPTTWSECKVMGSTEIGDYLASTNDTLMIRRVMLMDKGEHDGISVSNSGRMFGANPRVQWQYGTTNFDNRGEYLSLGYFEDDNEPDRDPQMRWACEHYFDVAVVKNATDYDARFYKDGKLCWVDTGLDLADVEKIIAEVQWENSLRSGSDVLAWQYLLAVRVTAWRGGGFANLGLPLGQSPNGAVGLPWWSDTDSVVSLHNAMRQDPSADASRDLSGVSGTVDLTTEHSSYDADRAFTNVYEYTGPSGTAVLPIHARPRHRLADGRLACSYEINFDTINQNGYDLRLTDEFGGNEFGLRIDAGTGDFALKYLYDDSGWTEESTGHTLKRDRMYSIMLSFVEGEAPGLTLTDRNEPGQDAEHGKRATLSGFTGLLSLRGGGTEVWSNNSASTTVKMFGPLTGVLAKQWESSYTSTGTPSVNTRIARSVRRALGADGGRGPCSSGFTPQSRPAGPFNALGRSGATIRNMLDDHIGGEGADWFRDARAFPVHIVDGTVNQLGLSIDRSAGRTLTQAAADWATNGAANTQAVLDDEAEIVGYMRAAGVRFVVGATATPPIETEETPDWNPFWTAEMRDAHHAINEERRARNRRGFYAGGFFFDMAAYWGSEALATAAGFAIKNVHPEESNGTGRADDQAEGLYWSVEEAEPVPSGRPWWTNRQIPA